MVVGYRGICVLVCVFAVLVSFPAFSEDLTCVDVGGAVNQANAYPFPSFDENHNAEYCGTDAWFSFDLVAGEGFTINFQPNITTGQLQLDLFDTNSTLISSTDRISNGASARIDHVAAQNNTYYLRVSGFNSPAGDYDLAVYKAWFNPGVTDNERGYYSTNYTARYAVNGEYTATGLRGLSVNPSAHRFGIGADTAVSVTVTAHLTAGDLDFGIFDEAGHEIESSNDGSIGNGQTGTATTSNLTAGYYYVKIWENGNDTAVGTYDLTITGADPDTDTDGDGLFDVAELFHTTSLTLTDSDGDGVSDYDELVNGTNPALAHEYTSSQVAGAVDVANAFPLPGLDRKVSIEHPGHDTWYAIDLKAGHGYSFLLYGHLNAGYLRYGLYDPDGVAIDLFNDIRGVQDGEYGLLEKRVGANGTYYLRVWEYTGTGSSPVTGKFDLLVVSSWFNPGIMDSDREDYNTYHTARYAVDGEYTATGLKGLEVKPSVHRFGMSQNSAVTVAVTAHVDMGDLDFGIYDGDGHEIERSSDSRIEDGQTGTATAANLTAGVYYIRVWEDGDDWVVGTYDLTITGADPDSDTDGDGLFDVAELFHTTSLALTDSDSDGVSDDDELTNGTNPAITHEYSSAEVAGAVDIANAFPLPWLDRKVSIEHPGHDTWYAIDLKAGHGYSFVLYGHLNAGYLRYGLYDSDGVAIDLFTDNRGVEDGEYGLLEQKIDINGTYYLRVWEYTGTGYSPVTGKFDLVVFNAWFNPGAADNNRDFYSTYYTARYAVNGEYTATGLKGNSVRPAVHRFGLNQTTSVSVSVTAHVDMGDLNFRIFDGDGNDIASSNNGSIEDGESGTATISNLPPGYYYIRVWENGDDWVVGTYDLTITGAGSDTDTDGDGLFDIAEHFHGTAWDDSDTDNDGVSDFQEVLVGRDPLIGDNLLTCGDVGTALDQASAYPIPFFNEAFFADYCGTETWYSFDLTAGEGITAAISANLISGRLRLYFYDSSGNQFGDSGYTYDGMTNIINYTAVVGDTYYLRLIGYSGAVGNYNLGIYKAWYNAGTSDEDRDFFSSYETARYLADGSYTLGYGTDYYRFTAQAGQEISFEVAAYLATGSIRGYLHDLRGNQFVDTGYIYNGQSINVSYSPVIGGTFYLRIIPFSGAYGHYDVSINSGVETDTDSDADGLYDAAEYFHGTDIDAADTDSDGISDYDELIDGRSPTFGGTLLTCTDVGGAVNQANAYSLPVLNEQFNADYCGTDAWYSFDLIAGEGFTAPITAHISTGRLRMYFYDAAGNAFGDSGYVYSDQTGTIDYKAVLNGTYYLRVVGNSGPIGNYDIGVYKAWFNAGVSDADRDYYSTYFTTRYLTAGNYTLTYDEDYYRFTAQAGQPISISATAHLGTGRIRLHLHDKYGNQLTYSGYVYNDGTDTVTYTPVISGTYYLRILGFDNVYGNYDLALNSGVDANTDSDADGLYDASEYFHSTNVDTSDTDGDGVSDYDELIGGRSPTFGGLLLSCADVGAAIDQTNAYPLPVTDEQFNADYCGNDTWYSFDLIAGEGFTAPITAHISTGRLRMYFYDAAGNAFGDSGYVYSDQTGTIDYQAVQSGTYYLRVVGNSGPIGNYDLGVYKAWFNAGVNDTDRDYYSTYFTSRYLAAGNYTLTYNEDYYRFTAQAGQPISISATAHLGTGQIRLYLHDKFGNQLADSGYVYNGGTGTAASTPVVSGIYYLRVLGFSNVYGNYDLVLTSGVDARADSDGDGLYDAAEYYQGTDVDVVDTDGDGMSDYDELLSGRSPTFGGQLLTCAHVGGAIDQANAFPLPLTNDQFNADYCGTDAWYRFDLTAGEGFTAPITAHISTGRLRMYFYDTVGNQFGDSGYVYNGQTGTIDYKSVVSGTYYLRVVGNGGPIGNYDLGVYKAWFNAGVSDVDRDYYSTYFTARYLMAGNYTLTHNEDYYRFTAQAGQPVSISATAHIGTGRIRLHLHDKYGNQLAYSGYVYNDGTGTAAYIPVVSGTYYLRILGFDNVYGNYDLVLNSGVDTDADSDTDNLYNATEYYHGTGVSVADTDGDGMSDYDELLAGRSPTLGGPLLTCTDVGGAIDQANAFPLLLTNEQLNADYCGTDTWYSFDLISGEGFTAPITAHISTGRLHMYLYDAAGNQFGYSGYVYNGGTGTIDYQAVVSGTYYLRVVGNSGPIGNYDLGVYKAWYNAGVSDTDRDYYSTYFTSRYLVAGNYTLTYNEDYYRFAAQAGQPISISATAHLVTGRIRLYLHDKFGNQHADSGYVYNGGTGTAAYTPVVSGTYYLRIIGNNNPYGNYDLVLNSGVDADTDSDGDGLYDAAEYYHGTDIGNSDTDGDGVSDFIELLVGRFPLGILVTSGAAREIIPPPSVSQGAIESDIDFIVFKEKEYVTLINDLLVNISAPGTYTPSSSYQQTIIPQNMIVNSYLIHGDSVGSHQLTLNGAIEFPDIIIGLAIFNNALDQSDYLGADNTNYPTGANRTGMDNVGGSVDQIILSADRTTLTIQFRLWNGFDQIRVITATDSDQDGIPNYWEISSNLNPNDPSDASLDYDNDGLTNIEEYLNGTDIHSPDTDGDGMPDGWEVAHNLDPNVNDAGSHADNDGLSNLDEYLNLTDPNNPDTDGDGINDGDEVANGTNPRAMTSSLTSELSELTLALGADRMILLQLENTRRERDQFDLSLSGLDQAWYSFQETTIILAAGEIREIPLFLQIPMDCQLTPADYMFQVIADSPTTGLVANGGVAITLSIQTAPVISQLIPAQSEDMATNSVAFSWETDVAASTVLYYRPVGQDPFTQLVGDPGTTHQMGLANLTWDTTYEWYAVSATICGDAQSEQRVFTIQDGVVFEQENMVIDDVHRDYDHQEPLTIINKDIVPHTVFVEIINPNEELIAGFVGSGSEDQILILEPGETQEIILALHAQDTTQSQYNLALRLTADIETGNPIIDYAHATINILIPDQGLLALSQLSSNPAIFTNTYEITNQGAPGLQNVVTDLSILAEEALGPQITFQPEITHMRLAPLESILFTATYHPGAGESQIDTAIIARGAGQETSINTHFGCETGTSIFQSQLTDLHLCLKKASWYCTNRRNIKVDFNIPPGIDPNTISRARLYIDFSKRNDRHTYYPHDVTIRMNGVVVETYTHTIPDGPRAIEVPTALINTGDQSTGRNRVRLQSNHNQGHYSINSNFQLILDVDAINFGAVCAISQQEADSLVQQYPFICDGTPDNVPCPEIESIRVTDQLGNPKWSFNPGETVHLSTTVTNPDIDLHNLNLSLTIDEDTDPAVVNLEENRSATLIPDGLAYFNFSWAIPGVNDAAKFYHVSVTGAGNGDCTDQESILNAIAVNQPVVGQVQDYETGAGMPNVQVCALVLGPGGLVPVCTTTDGDGLFSLLLPEGEHVFFATHDGFSYDSVIVDTATVSPMLYLSHDSSHFGDEADSGYANDPVNTALGNFTQHHKDLSFKGRGLSFSFERFYNSQDNYNGPLGFGWTHNYNIIVTKTGNTAVVKFGDGREEFYVQQPNDSYTSQPGVHNIFTEETDGSFNLRTKRQTIYLFSSNGRLMDIVDKNGNAIVLTYNGDQLVTVTDPVGRVVQFTYDAQGRITQLTDPINRTIRFNYDTAGDLVSAFDAMDHETVYTYDNLHQMLTATDPEGNVFVTNTYDDERRVVTAQSDALGNVSSFEYDQESHVTEFTDPMGNTTVHVHDNLNRLFKVIDALRNTESMSYDDDHNKTSVVDKRGNETFYEYDDRGNLTKIVDAIGHETLLSYDETNNLTHKTDALGNLTAFEYDLSGNLAKTIDPDLNETVYTVNAYGQPTVITNALGNPTYFDYDSQGNLVETTDALGNFETRSYDGVGRMMSKTDQNGHTTSYTYNDNDQILTTTDPAPFNYVVTNTYDDNGNRTGLTDKRNNTTSYEYDAKNRLVSITDPMGNSISYEYDSLDRKVSRTDQRGIIVRFDYDAVGNLTSQTNAVGYAMEQVIDRTYDENGNLIRTTDPLGISIYYTYDELNRKISEQDNMGHITQFDYDAMNRLVSKTDANGQTIYYEYDALGRLVNATEPGSAETTFGYDAVGNKTSFTNANNTTFNYTFDELNRLRIDADGYQHDYDAAGNIIGRTDAKGQLVEFSYDALNRMTEKQYPDTRTTTYGYDGNSNLTAMTDDVGMSSRQYDPLNRLVEITDPFGKVVQFNYDAAGNRSQIVYPDSNLVQYDYDPLNRLSTVTDWSSRITSYQYDVAGNLESTTYPNGSRTNYAYDQANRLNNMANQLPDSTVINSYDYTLDAVGNRTQVEKEEPLIPFIKTQNITYQYDTDNRLVSTNNGIFSYDANGSVTQKVIGTHTTDYTWNEDNRLASVSTSEGNTSTYLYNGLSNRLAAVRNGVTTRYVLDPSIGLPNVIAETDETGVITSRYIYGLGLISKEDAGGIHYYHFDSRGSTIAITDTTGNFSDKYAYDPFGTLANRSGSSDNPFTYIGQFGLMNEGEGLYFVRARYYDSEIGRFLKKDIYLGEDTIPHSLQRYIYSVNNPIGKLDSSGLCTIESEFKESPEFQYLSSVLLAYTKLAVKEYMKKMQIRGLVYGDVHIFGRLSVDNSTLGGLEKGMDFLTLATFAHNFGKELGQNWDNPNMDWTEKLGRATLRLTVDSTLAAINVYTGGATIPHTIAIGMIYEETEDAIWDFLKSEYFIADAWGDWIYYLANQTEWTRKLILE